MSELSLHEMERAFKVLGNINRLRLLVDLQEPKGYSEIDLPPSRSDGAGGGERTITRQAVRSHLQHLLDLGLVREVEAEGTGQRFIVDHSRLFALMERMREIASVKATMPVEEQTMNLTDGSRTQLPACPHLALVRGVHEGRVFPLEAKGETRRWLLGRQRDADVCLDYDAYVSSEHAEVLQQEDQHYLRDLPVNRNGTFLNWQRLQPGSTAPLKAGDVVGVGRSLLIFRQ